eukprot:6173803-Lingulodinium_polyedra.AAC.1
MSCCVLPAEQASKQWARFQRMNKKNISVIVVVVIVVVVIAVPLSSSSSLSPSSSSPLSSS